MELNEDARAIFDAMREGITIIDTEGRIVFGNLAYRAFLNKEAGGDIGPIEGYRLRDLRPGARLPEVLETGQPHLHITRQEIQDFYFVNMYPIYRDGELRGGLSVVTFLDDAYRTREELDAMEAKSKQVLNRINKANGARYTFDDITAHSSATLQVKELAEKIAATDATVLLEAESGAGKELYAQAIHNASPRRDGVFVAINCSNFNGELLDSELFGYVEGAFTGAKRKGKMGLFEAAYGGTLFLDEISEMDLGLQAKLLRALQERRIRPVGGVKEIDIDVRVIAACNVDLERYVQEGKFRKDLYYRLNVYPITVLPLRKRRADIVPLAKYFVERYNREFGLQKALGVKTLEFLENQPFRGNIRELQNLIQRLMIMTDYQIIEVRDVLQALSADLSEAGAPEEEPAVPTFQAALEGGSLKEMLGRREREILRLYQQQYKSTRRMARLLGISQSSVVRKLHQYGLQAEEV